MSKAVLRPIIPKTPLYSTDAYQREIKKALDKLGKDVKKAFEATTSTWNTAVDFEVDVTLNKNEAQVVISTDNEIYGYVSGGTKPHIIRPRRARYLRFLSGYRAKTRVRGSTNAQAGGSFGNPVFATIVHHPGTKARHFERRVVVKFQDILPVVIQQAIDRASKGG